MKKLFVMVHSPSKYGINDKCVMGSFVSFPNSYVISPKPSIPEHHSILR